VIRFFFPIVAVVFFGFPGFQAFSDRERGDRQGSRQPVRLAGLSTPVS
jgi:hypothetical protein